MKNVNKLMLLCCFLAGLCAVVSAESEIQTYTLKNGIPVHFKANTDNQIDAIGIAVSGGVTQLTPDQSGLEQVLFSLMTTSSAKYDYQKRQMLSFDKKSLISASSSQNGSVLSLSCINYYFDDMLPVFLDGFMKPKFAKKEYDMLMTSTRNQIQYMQNDPVNLLMYSGAKEVYKNHPYATFAMPIPESIESITIDNMKKLHKQILDARRISVVAVGNMNPEKLVKKLNATIGSIPALKTVLKDTTVPPLVISGDPLVISHTSAAGTGFIARGFATPSCINPDYFPAMLASDMFSELMFNIVRVKHGACYSPNCSVEFSPASYGMEFLYRTSDLKHFTSYIKEARNIMAQGLLIRSVNSNGTYTYDTIADRLESYKNSAINGIYSSSATTRGIIGRMLSSLLMYNDVTTMDERPANIRQVTAADIERIFKQYWIEGDSRWFAVVGPDDLETIQFSEK